MTTTVKKKNQKLNYKYLYSKQISIKINERQYLLTRIILLY
jgi:hypothetical protein